MIKIYSHQNPSLIHHLKNVLQVEGIHAEVKNEILGGTVGQIPPTECWVELWIVNEASYPEAMAIIEGAVGDENESSESWTCAGCGEENEGQFAVCWKCGKEG